MAHHAGNKEKKRGLEPDRYEPARYSPQDVKPVESAKEPEPRSANIEDLKANKRKRTIAQKPPGLLRTATIRPHVEAEQNESGSPNERYDNEQEKTKKISDLGLAKRDSLENGGDGLSSPQKACKSLPTWTAETPEHGSITALPTSLSETDNSEPDSGGEDSTREERPGLHRYSHPDQVYGPNFRHLLLTQPLPTRYASPLEGKPVANSQPQQLQPSCPDRNRPDSRPVQLVEVSYGAGGQRRYKSRSLESLPSEPESPKEH
ncbi:uncharacterized protein J3D65DRAFT_673523 [Phyllosticta citribraziliensis]|uniref:Uncharacterized protein n=1 Tax=Phyllosticta citribraziliensis TaxID=989973 RepID=A0ABR1MAB2_9PEZI